MAQDKDEQVRPSPEEAEPEVPSQNPESDKSSAMGPSSSVETQTPAVEDPVPVDGAASSQQAQNPQTQNPQTLNIYQANRQLRLEHGSEWWGNIHREPTQGHPDRQHIYAHNPPISDQEVHQTLQAYRTSIKDPVTGTHDSMAVHLRSSSPPLERAQRQLQGLRDQGVAVSDELAKEIHDHYTRNNGLVAALTVWCENRTDLPVDYANELLKMIDRLKLEMSKQQRDLQNKLSQTIEDYTKEIEKALKDLEEQKQKTKEANMIAQIWSEQLDTREKDLKQEQESCKVERKGREEAEKDVRKYKFFHDSFFKELKKRAQTWTMTDKGYENLSQNPAVRNILNEVAKDWKELETSYETNWPPTTESLQRAKLRDNVITLAHYERSEKDLKAKKEHQEKLKKDLDKQIKENEAKRERLTSIQRSDGGPAEKLDETSIPSSRPSSELPRSPVGSKNDAPEPSRMSSVTTLEHTSGLAQKDGEITRLREVESTLRKELADKSEDNGRLKKARTTSSSTNSSPEGEGSEVADEKIKELRSQIQRQTGEINELNRANNKEEDLRTEVKSLRHQANIYRNRLEYMGQVNFKTVDSVVRALQGENKESNGRNEMSLMDRINYLNIASLLRACNYLHAALQGDLTKLPNMILTDAVRLMHFGRQDFAKMDSSVNAQIDASMRILYGYRKAMTTRTEAGMLKAQESLKSARKIFLEHDKSDAFNHVTRLANTTMSLIQEIQDKNLFEKKPSSNISRLFLAFFRAKQELKSPVRRRIQAGTAGEMPMRSRAGDSPLSPDKWHKLNKDTDKDNKNENGNDNENEDDNGNDQDKIGGEPEARESSRQQEPLIDIDGLL